MSSNRSGIETQTDPREAVLEKLEDAMDDLSQAIGTADPATSSEEQMQLRRYHELGYLANQYRKLKRETSLIKMDRRLAILEAERDDETT